MLGPTDASIAADGNEACAGICRLASGRLGWFVPMRRRMAVLELLVVDPNSSFSARVPFLIDTGSTITVLPRTVHDRLASGQAFARHSRGRPVSGLRLANGRLLAARPYDSFLYILPTPPGGPHFTFGCPFTIHVVEEEMWEGGDAIGLLGTDALSQLTLVADRGYVTLWPPAEGAD
jgi:hypothetical protein